MVRSRSSCLLSLSASIITDPPANDTPAIQANAGRAVRVRQENLDVIEPIQRCDEGGDTDGGAGQGLTIASALGGEGLYRFPQNEGAKIASVPEAQPYRSQLSTTTIDVKPP